MLTWFDDNGVMWEPGEIGLMTNEGPAGIEELIDFLKVQEPLDELEWQKDLMWASKDHVDDTGPEGITGHTGTDGSSPFDRMERYVTLEGTSGESVAYGTSSP